MFVTRKKILNKYTNNYNSQIEESNNSNNKINNTYDIPPNYIEDIKNNILEPF